MTTEPAVATALATDLATSQPPPTTFEAVMAEMQRAEGTGMALGELVRMAVQAIKRGHPTLADFFLRQALRMAAHAEDVQFDGCNLCWVIEQLKRLERPVVLAKVLEQYAAEARQEKHDRIERILLEALRDIGDTEQRARAETRLAELLETSGDLKGAELVCRRALVHTPDSDRANEFARLDVLKHIVKAAKGKDALKPVLLDQLAAAMFVDAFKVAAVLGQLGDLYYHLKSWTEADEAYRKAVYVIQKVTKCENDPRTFDWLDFIGNCRTQIGGPKAEEDFRTIVGYRMCQQRNHTVYKPRDILTDFPEFDAVVALTPPEAPRPRHGH